MKEGVLQFNAAKADDYLFKRGVRQANHFQ